MWLHHGRVYYSCWWSFTYSIDLKWAYALTGYLKLSPWPWLNCFWLVWIMWVYVLIGVRPARCRASICVRNFNVAIFSDTTTVSYYNCQTLHDGNTYWGLPIHITFSDLDCISRSLECQTVLSKTFCSYPIMLKLCKLVITSSWSWIHLNFLFLHMFKGWLASLCGAFSPVYP